MAGRIDGFNNVLTKQNGYLVKLTKIYCDGAQQRFDDAGGPATANPYDTDEQTQEFDAWAEGWSSRDTSDIVVNGEFDLGGTGWTLGDGWAIAAGVATSDGTQIAVSDLVQTAAVALVEGLSYEVTFSVTVFTAGTVTPIVGGTLGTPRATAATFTETIVAGSGATIGLQASEDFVGTIDNIIIGEVLVMRDQCAVPLVGGALVP